MVKTIISAVLLAQAIFGFPKANYFFPEFTFKEVKLKEINKDSAFAVVKGLKDYWRIFGPTDIYDAVNHFYLSDIDKDKKSELIYYGLTSAKGYWSIIWKSDNQKYYLFGELFGEIIGINDSLLVTFAPGGCGSDCDCANLYRIIEESIDFVRSVKMVKGVKTPDSSTTKKK
jgi:hypothetical protein